MWALDWLVCVSHVHLQESLLPSLVISQPWEVCRSRIKAPNARASRIVDRVGYFCFPLASHLLVVTLSLTLSSILLFSHSNFILNYIT